MEALWSAQYFHPFDVGQAVETDIPWQILDNVIDDATNRLFGREIVSLCANTGISFAYVRNRLAGPGGKDGLVDGVVDALREQLNFLTEK